MLPELLERHPISSRTHRVKRRMNGGFRRIQLSRHLGPSRDLSRTNGFRLTPCRAYPTISPHRSQTTCDDVVEILRAADRKFSTSMQIWDAFPFDRYLSLVPWASLDLESGGTARQFPNSIAGGAPAGPASLP